MTTYRAIDRMREAYDTRMIDRHLAEEEWREAAKFALGPQAPDCDEPSECTCPMGVGACERPPASHGNPPRGQR